MSPPLILRLDISGTPVRWIPWQEAVCLYTREMVGWTTGDNAFTFLGGTSRASGQRSAVTVHSIIAVKHSQRGPHHTRLVPPLSNHDLFRRDGNLCMYCGREFPDYQLTRDHIVPLSQGGRDRWSNVVSACRGCNTRKGGRTPEQSNMPLLAVPYVPNWAEFLALSNRRILADQMEFLKSQFNHSNPRRALA
ncbi:MAG: HNH endonuclease [Gammaproteobacteria bacterium]|nr:HNH endonuclease [Gammaproteobacteria bacterium]MCP5201940.1 HNH endonuclease [Gammaproteobacteria bacterium]